MTPKLWLEALDDFHRYGSWLYPYWQRWELSKTRHNFFAWLDEGRGCLIDLPNCPRRFLTEGRVLYLSREEKKLFEVQISPDGRCVCACVCACVLCARVHANGASACACACAWGGFGEEQFAS
jgi:hypothetical protein